MMRLADYVAKRLADAGITHAFLVTGGGAMHLNDALGREGRITKVFNHHEQASAMAAESYFRLSGRLCALNVTTGPGGINALNGVHGAFVDSIGMVVISGQVKRETMVASYNLPLRQLGDQEADIAAIAGPIVKYMAVVMDPKTIRARLDLALYLATHGRPGPVWLDIPLDVQGAPIEPDELTPFDFSNPKNILDEPGVHPNVACEFGLAEDLDAPLATLLEKLKNSKRPVVFAGAGVRLSGAHEEFLKVVQKLGIPVVTGWNAHDALCDDHPLYVGRPGTVGDRAGNFAVQLSDFILVLGSRLNIRQISYNWASFASRAYKVMVDADSAELKKPTLMIDLAIHADLKRFLTALAQKLEAYEPQKAHGQYLAKCRALAHKYPTVLPEYAKSPKVNPYSFMEKLFGALSPDDVIVTGDGTACVVSFQAGKLKTGQRLYTNSGAASMGYDLPGAIGAVYAGAKRVICLAGDGSVMMNLQELQTIAGYKLPVKIFVLNNEGYHSIRQTQDAYFPDNEVGVGPNSGVTFPDFVRVGEAFGIPSARVGSLGALDRTIGKALEETGPTLVEVMLDITQPFSPKLASRKLPDGTMVSSPLEDLSPFLARDELAKIMEEE